MFKWIRSMTDRDKDIRNEKLWDRRFITLAQLVGSWSKDPNTKMGAVIVDDLRRVISVGFNGFPRGIADDNRLQIRDQKLATIIHAEQNALLFASKDLRGTTLYTSPMPPCSLCMPPIIQAGIIRIVHDGAPKTKWVDSMAWAYNLAIEAGIEIVRLEKD